MTSSGQPILVLKEGTTQSRGRRAQANNIMAATLIADIVKTSFGPKGMDKMLVDSTGDMKVTSDGATILKEIDVQHPAAKAMVEIAKATDNEVGDGTTSSVILAGALLDKARELIEKGVHPTVITDGYKKALVKSLEILSSVAVKVDPKDRSMLEKVARTSMAAKIVSREAESLAPLVVEAILSVAEEYDGRLKVDVSDVKVEKKAGGSIGDTKMVRGLIIPKEIMHSGMPKRVSNARVLVINCPLKVEKPEFDAKISISNPEQMKMFLDEESEMLKGMVDKIAAVGANVIVTNKEIDDVAQHYLAKAKIMAVRRDLDADLGRLSKATGARMITNIEDLRPEDLGYAEVAEERKVEDEKWVFFEGCKNPKAVSILVRGGTAKIVDEVERSIHDALCVVKDVMIKPSIVFGAGSPEEEVASKLREWAETLSGREQLAVQKYAEAAEVIPLTLAENAGMDPIDTMVDLRARHSRGQKTAGVNVLAGKVQDARKFHVYEPLAVKEQVFKAATEAANMILRIDDVIAASGAGASKSVR